jgi:hypothetical protein
MWDAADEDRPAARSGRQDALRDALPWAARDESVRDKSVGPVRENSAPSELRDAALPAGQASSGAEPITWLPGPDAAELPDALPAARPAAEPVPVPAASAYPRSVRAKAHRVPVPAVAALREAAASWVPVHRDRAVVFREMLPEMAHADRREPDLAWARHPMAAASRPVRSDVPARSPRRAAWACEARALPALRESGPPALRDPRRCSERPEPMVPMAGR